LLGSLPTAQIGTMLMQLDMRAIQVPQFAHGVPSEDDKHPGEPDAGTPTPIARIDGGPRSVTFGQIAPARGSLPRCAICPRRIFRLESDQFFSRAQRD
jgi:hypothetical protein